jgi:hypothetical protein
MPDLSILGSEGRCAVCETTMLRDAIAGVAAAARAGGVSSDELVGLLRARERLDAVILTALGCWDRDKVWEHDGARSPVAWLAHRAPLTRQDASGLVRTARHVRRFDQTAKALDTGDITATHATVAARAAKHREDQYRTDEPVILDCARDLDPTGFRSVMQYWRACADDTMSDAPEPEPERDYLDIATTFGGVGHLDGRFDPTATRTITQCLDALEPPDGVRTLSQRRAAALLRLVTGDRAPRRRST